MAVLRWDEGSNSSPELGRLRWALAGGSPSGAGGRARAGFGGAAGPVESGAGGWLRPGASGAGWGASSQYAETWSLWVEWDLFYFVAYHMGALKLLMMLATGAVNPYRRALCSCNSWSAFHSNEAFPQCVIPTRLECGCPPR